MANPEHLDILRQGVEVWNAWRKEHPGEEPDLSHANLSNAKLDGINLKKAYLIDMNFTMANLQEADLSEANLRWSILRGANLRGANLSRAKFWNVYLENLNAGFTNLSDTDLTDADLGGINLSNINLSGANLSGARLGNVNFTNAVLNESNFTGAILSGTSFGDRDLRVIKGLENAIHQGPSPLSINTIYLSDGDIPETFLRGTGVPDTFITSMNSFFGKPIEYYSCFISYSSKDQALAERLYADLQSNNIRCWYAPANLRVGDKFRVRIDESVQLYDRLLLILSEHSVRSPWIKKEVEMALNKEHKTGKLVLFPVKLDNTIEETEQAWAADMHRTRHIGDFTRWKEHDEYQRALSRLMRDLIAAAPNEMEPSDEK